MRDRLRFYRAFILVLSLFFGSITTNCTAEYPKETSSDAEIGASNELEKNRYIEEIFRGPETKSHEPAVVQKRSEIVRRNGEDKEFSKHVRVKRVTSNERNNVRSSKESERSNERRSIADKNSAPVASKTRRSSQELRRVVDKESSDYNDAPIDRASTDTKVGSNYAEEVKDEAASAPRSKEVGYGKKNLRGTADSDDSDGFTDQEERSSLYDDFESKDVVKRGVSGAEDYEEVEEKDENSSGTFEEDAALQETDSTEDEENKGIRGDSRVKRDRGSRTKLEDQVENVETSGKSDDSLKDGKNEVKLEDETSKHDVKSAEKEDEKIVNKVSKEDGDLEKDDSRIDLKRISSNDKAELEAESESLKGIEENSDVQGEKRTEDDGLSKDKKLTDLSSPGGLSKLEESRIVEIAGPSNSKLDSPISKDAATNEAPKTEDSKNTETSNDNGEDYEKRVEEQIQQKIDSIKEEIKRDIEQKERIKEIEENNAKFDELRDQEDEDDELEQNYEGEKSHKRQNPSKRSTSSKQKSESKENEKSRKRSTRRSKRQDEMDPEKIRENVDRVAESNHEAARKRSISRREVAGASSKLHSKISPVKKREYARQVILVKNDGDAGRKRRRRRSKNFMLIPEQARMKIEDSLPADVSLDSNLRGDLVDAKSPVTREERREAEEELLAEKRSDNVASLTANSQELGPRVATDYKEAFGGLQREPGVALARFKRIKRVLRAPNSRTQ